MHYSATSLICSGNHDQSLQDLLSGFNKKNGARGESEPMVQSSECLILLMLPLFYSLYTVADISKTFSSISSDFIIYRLFHTCITLIIMSQTQLFCCLYTKKAKFYHTLSDLLWFGFRGFLKHFFLCLV